MLHRPEHWREAETELVTTPHGVSVPRRAAHILEAGDGMPAVALEVDLGPQGTSSTVTALEVDSAGEGVTADQLRRLARDLEPLVVRHLVGRHFALFAMPAQGGALGSVPGAAQQAVTALDRRRRARLPEEDLREAAEIYLDERHHETCKQLRCYDTRPRPPRHRVAAHFTISTNTVDDWLRKAREPGRAYLPPTTQGRKGVRR